MSSSFRAALSTLAIFCVSLSHAAPLESRAAPAAPQVASLSTAVNVTSNDNPPNNKRWYRDGGYLGVIGNRHFTMNFDTCLDGPTEGKNCQIGGGNSFTDIVSASVVHDPDTSGGLTVLCTSSQYDHTFVFNTINIDGTNGLAYATDVGPPGETGIGIFPAIINVANNIPTCQRQPVLFPGGKGPQYGNAGSIIGPAGFLYLYGTGGNDNGIYIARVDPTKYNTLSAYSYWNGALFDSNPANAVEILSQAFGGSVTFNQYYNAYMFLNTQIYFGGIGGQIATNPWGPFSNRTVLFQDTSNAGGTYQPNGLPQFDTSGKSLVVRYSAPNGYYQKEIKVTFQ